MKKIIVLLLLLGGLGQAQVEPRADQILQDMSAYLAARQEFAFRVEASFDEELSGHWVEYSSTTHIMVSRPGSVCAFRDGDQGRRYAFFNGKELVIYSPDDGYYAQHGVAGDIPAMLDFAHEELKMSLPVADFLFPEPYKVLTTDVKSGFYVGMRQVEGQPCHHLFFVTNSGLEWQIWIDAGKRRVPRKLLLRYANEPGAPQYGASFYDWDFSTPLAPDLFNFVPPPDSHLLETHKEEQE